MTSFEIPIQELKDSSVDIDQLIQLLELIGAPTECTDFGRVISTLFSSAKAISSLAPTSPKLKELANLTHALWEYSHLFTRHEAVADKNPMFGRYGDYPFYSLLTQHSSTNNEHAVADRFHLFIGLVLASAWTSNTPIPRNYDKFLEELRIIRRDNKPSEILSIIENAGSIQRIINSFSSKSENILKLNFRNLAIKIQESMPLDQNCFHPLDDIENSLLGDTEEGETNVETFREIFRVLRFRCQSVEQLDYVLQSLETLLPISASFDNRFADVWSRWLTIVCTLRKTLQDRLSGAVLAPQEIQFLEAQELIGALIAVSAKNVHSGLVAAKAILIVGLYAKYHQYEIDFKKHTVSIFPEWNYRHSGERNLAIAIARCYLAKKSVFLGLAKQFLPEWPCATTSHWTEEFISNSTDVPNDESYKDQYGYHPDKYTFIRTIRRILDSVSAPAEDFMPRQQNANSLSTPPTSSTSPPEQNSPLVIQPARDRRTTVVTQASKESYSRSGRKLSVGPSFDLFREQPVRLDIDAAALAPDAIRVIPQQDTAADQPARPASVQSLEIRYTNYRTAMDNQHLPWSWDCLNRFEISALRSALEESANLEQSTTSERLGAFFVWLLLATGQTIKQILQLGLVSSPNNRGSLLFGPIYRRNIHPPPYAFHPSKEQSGLLFGHAEYIDLPLPQPFPALVRELGLIDSSIKLVKQRHSLGEYLKLNEQDADKVVRQFLEVHRTRSMRLLPGRIRNVLGAEIMRVSNDPVATHHLTALPSDMPPSGVYYTSFSKDVLKGIYDEALTRIFGESA